MQSYTARRLIREFVLKWRIWRSRMLRGLHFFRGIAVCATNQEWWMKWRRDLFSVYDAPITIISGASKICEKRMRRIGDSTQRKRSGRNNFVRLQAASRMEFSAKMRYQKRSSCRAKKDRQNDRRTWMQKKRYRQCLAYAGGTPNSEGPLADTNFVLFSAREFFLSTSLLGKAFREVMIRLSSDPQKSFWMTNKLVWCCGF